MSTERLTRSKRARMRQRGRALRRLRMIGILTLLLCLPSLLVWGSLEWLPKLKKSEFFAARVWTVKGVSYANAETLRRELDALLGTPLALIDRQSLAGAAESRSLDQQRACHSNVPASIARARLRTAGHRLV